MFPTLLKLGPITLHSYGLMMAIAFLVTLYLVQRDATKFGLDPNALTDLCFWTLLAGIVGARVLHIIMYPKFYAFDDPLGWIAIWNGGLVFQGGLMAGILFCYFYLRVKSIDHWLVADVGLPYLAIGHALGRLGCFLNGCCYGKATNSIFGVSFPRVPDNIAEKATGSPAYLDQFGERGTELWAHPVHPTQLYESVGLIVMCLFLLALRKYWHPFRGFMLAAYIVSYGLLRFFIEFFRGDKNPTHFGALSDQQVFSLVFVVAGLVVFFVLRRIQLKRRPA